MWCVTQLSALYNELGKSKAPSQIPMDRIFDLLRAYFHSHGYWTVAGALLLENAGIPVPGETILLFASFLASSERQLHLPWIIVVGTAACTLGDNLGYFIGHRGGRPLLNRWKYLFRIKEAHIQRGERLFERFGPATIFFARFVFGMRIIAGPLAGVLLMPWKQFVLFNFLGAALWVTVISSVGYFFGRHWEALLQVIRDVNLGILIGLGVLALALWLIRRRRAAREKERESEAVRQD
jgi:membrane protein DedA with SNARE-associated domain